MVEIQRAILTIIITEPKKRAVIFKELDERHFTDKYKTIFNTCKQRYINKQEIDSILLVGDLGKSYLITINEIATDTNYYSALNEYISKLKEYYSRTKAIQATEKVLFEVNNKPLYELRKDYIEISKLFDTDIEKYEIISMKQGLIDAFGRLEHKKSYYKTGFEKLDKRLLIDKGDYIIIGGRPSAGKTAFALNIMLNMSSTHKVLFFSFETSPQKIYDRILSAVGKVSFSNILNSNVAEDDYSKIASNIDKYHKNSFEVVQAAGMSVDDIRNISIEKQADIVFLDYLGLINKKGMGPNIYEQMTNISNQLHIFAQGEKTTVVALTQLSRTAENKEPTMADIRDSGAIEQDADAIMLLHNENSQEFNSDNDIRTLSLVKNKTGAIGKQNYKFYGRVQTFYEM